MVKNLNMREFKKRVLLDRETCVIKFYSDSCPLCINLAPIYQEIATEYGKLPKKINFYKVDVNNDEGLSDRLNFDGVPTLFLFHKGVYSEIPYPYDNPDDLTGYRKADIIDYINVKVNK